VLTKWLEDIADVKDKPEDGVNALDAAVTAYNAIAMLRQHLPTTHKITIVIKGSERFISNSMSPSAAFLSKADRLAVPNRASIWVGVRAPTGKETVAAIDRVLNCLKAGALSSGCSYEISREHMYMDMQQSEAFTEYFTQVTEGKYGKESYPVDRTPITAGTDLVSRPARYLSQETDQTG
jgi:metal-dependent amidase/aminoacylase/carboxypeptidase family protein